MATARTASTPPAPVAAPGIDDLVDATPATRDRTVDAVRALCIVVVVLWHWVLSITHVTADGRLSMPNPVDEVPLAWLATWVLQVMPAFFVVGGFANLASWERLERTGPATARRFAATRLRRLGRPVLACLAAWAVADLVATRLLGAPSVLHWGVVVFVPLWFLGAYGAVLSLTPLTVAAHRRAPWLSLAGLAGAAAALDVARFTTGQDAWGLATTAVVWVFAHQLGYLWRDGTAVAWGRPGHVTLVAGGAAALALLTTSGPYPSSMVAVRGDDISNMFPTITPVAALAVVQLGVVLLARPRLDGWLARRRPWRAVVAVNAVAMTVFTWHMTALVTVVGAALALGFDLPSDTSPTWWLLRPLWLLLPGLVLAGLVRAFAPLELAGRR